MAQKRFDVAVIGNVGVDTNVYFHGADVDFSGLEPKYRLLTIDLALCHTPRIGGSHG